MSYPRSNLLVDQIISDEKIKNNIHGHVDGLYDDAILIPLLSFKIEVFSIYSPYLFILSFIHFSAQQMSLNTMT